MLRITGTLRSLSKLLEIGVLNFEEVIIHFWYDSKQSFEIENSN